MIKVLPLLIIPVLTFLMSCSLQSSDSSEGIIWQKDLKSPPSAGIEIHADNLYFADESGTIYSCWIDTGFINWKRRMIDEKIKMIFITDSGLGVISQKIGGGPRPSIFRIFTFEKGIAVFETNLQANIRDSYDSDNADVIAHSPSCAVLISRTGKNIKICDLSSYTKDIVAFASWGGSYYAIDGDSRILRFNPSMRQTGSYVFKGIFSGDAVYDNGRIYISTDSGVKILNTVTWSPESAENDITGLSKPVLFDGMSAGLVKKTAGPSQRYFLFSNQSFKTPPGSNSYSPIIYSDTLGVAAFIDQKGYLNIVDSRTGYFVYSKFIGNINRPFLKVSKDYRSKSVFVPLSSPAKIFCYSLKFASSQKMPR